MKFKTAKKKMFCLNLLSVGLVGVGCMGATASNVVKAQNKTKQSANKDATGDTSTDTSLSNPITTEQLASFQKATIDKYAALLNFYNEEYAGSSSPVDIDQQVGIMKYDFATFTPKPELNGFVKEMNATMDDNTQKYNHVLEVANKLNLNVLDTYSLTQNQNKQYAAKMYSSLLGDGSSQDDAKQKSTAYLATLNKYSNRAENHMWSPNEYAMHLAQASKSIYKEGKSNKTIRTSQDTVPPDIQEALTILQHSVSNSKLRAKNTNMFDQQKLCGYLSVYSKNGIYNKDSIIDPNDVAKWFTYDYDINQGVDLSDYAVDTDDIPQSTSGGQYADWKATETKDFSTFNGVGGTLKLCEFTDGYVAHVKIIDCNYTDNSHKATITFQFGVSDITDDTNKIYWSELDKATLQKVNSDGTNENGVMQITAIPSESEIIYAAKNVFYPADFNTASITLDDSNRDANGSYFSGTSMPATRAKIDDMLKNAWFGSDGDYDLWNHPKIIPITDVLTLGAYDGIPIPPELKFFFDNPNQLLHHNQTLGLKIVGMDYDNEWLDISWCLIDLDSSSDSDPTDTSNSPAAPSERDQDGQLDVKDIPWLLPDGTQRQFIQVAYPVDQTTKTMINTAKTVITFFWDLRGILDTTMKITPDKWDKMKTKADSEYVISAICDAMLCLLTALDIALAIAAAWGAANFVRELVYGLLFAALDAVIAIFTSIQTVNDRNSFEKAEKVYHSVHEHPNAVKQVDILCDTVGDVAVEGTRGYIINDTHHNIDDRKEKCKEVLKFDTEIFQLDLNNKGFIDWMTQMRDDGVLVITDQTWKNLRAGYIPTQDWLFAAGTCLSQIFTIINKIFTFIIGYSAKIASEVGQIAERCLAKSYRVAGDAAEAYRSEIEPVMREAIKEAFVNAGAAFEDGAVDAAAAARDVTEQLDDAEQFEMAIQAIEDTTEELQNAHIVAAATAAKLLSIAALVVSGLTIALQLIQIAIDALC